MRTLPTYVFATLEQRTREYSGNAGSLINLGIGSPDQPMPKPVAQALGAAALGNDVSGYPHFGGDASFLQAASWYLEDRFGHKFDPEREILALAGSKEGVAELLISTLDTGDVALVPSINYPVYTRATWLANAEVELLPMPADNGFLADWSQVSADVLQRAKVLIINYPNNPTGAAAGIDYYEHAVAFARANNLILVSDAAYAEITFDGRRSPSVFDVEGARDVAVEFHSLSKAFSMAGLRIGFMAGRQSLIDVVKGYRTSIGYGVATVIQRAGATALRGHRTFVPTTVARYESRRNATIKAFAEAGWQIDSPAGAMYLWFRVSDDDWKWTARVLESTGVALTPGSAFGPGGSGFARLSLVRDEAALVEAVNRITAQPSLHP
jgi:LL-diaminopimelate aminotransferase